MVRKFYIIEFTSDNFEEKWANEKAVCYIAFYMSSKLLLYIKKPIYIVNVSFRSM